MEVMRNWEVQSAIAVVSRQQKANNNIIRFIITFLFRGFLSSIDWAKVRNKDEKWKKRRDHFFHFEIIIRNQGFYKKSLAGI